MQNYGNEHFLWCWLQKEQAALDQSRMITLSKDLLALVHSAKSIGSVSLAYFGLVLIVLNLVIYEIFADTGRFSLPYVFIYPRLEIRPINQAKDIPKHLEFHT